MGLILDGTAYEWDLSIPCYSADRYDRLKVSTAEASAGGRREAYISLRHNVSNAARPVRCSVYNHKKPHKGKPPARL